MSHLFSPILSQLSKLQQAFFNLNLTHELSGLSNKYLITGWLLLLQLFQKICCHRVNHQHVHRRVCAYSTLKYCSPQPFTLVVFLRFCCHRITFLCWFDAHPALRPWPSTLHPCGLFEVLSSQNNLSALIWHSFDPEGKDAVHSELSQLFCCQQVINFTSQFCITDGLLTCHCKMPQTERRHVMMLH